MLKLSIHKPEELAKVAHALSSEVRIHILQLLNNRNMNIIEIAEALNIPVSTAASNIRILEKSGLILTELHPGVRGVMKVCSRNFDDVLMALNPETHAQGNKNKFEIDMPVGHFVDCEVHPTCGMANTSQMIIPEDHPSSFFQPNRITAQLIWFRKGYVEYKFPLGAFNKAEIESLQFSLELCSEAPRYDNDWPSDITVCVNDTEIGTWMCPGDFGGRKGRLNPAWWPENSTQFGMLKTWKVDRSKSSVDDVPISDVTLVDLNISGADFISFKIGIKSDAVHKGGVNLFGKEFGDFDQDIKMTICYSD
ncbi:helix-turn-helix domain-containing protein [Paenibacillus filicis]|uniref:Helix-turn-helix domain-containing protein n=1 Tax=Paenibacillus gyeongsangnamensis TaxID=3388067 RepID=A0ABT4Q3Z8_9BACL|nr:ArsR family transcriptional regulator [Paenibacillus filicis]MCZ8511602.1 helix-turn-helix domain-containing protein [Paenibacillus filicis]